jgi:hypothetical protein
MVVDHRDRMEVSFTYRADLFDDGTVRELAAEFERLLAAYTKDPDLVAG